MRRVACIALPEVRIEIARERISREDETRKKDVPLAVVVARPGGSVETERDILGNTRLDVVSQQARALGVRAGQTVAAARARCTELRVRVVAQDAVRAALVRVTEAALAFGPGAAFSVVEDIVWVEIGGASHLRGGERELAQELGARIHALGHACRIAVADGPRIAAAIARTPPGLSPGSRTLAKSPRTPFGGGEPGDKPGENCFLVVPEGKGAAAMRGLPVEALALDAEVIAWLRDLGLRTCGDLQKLPRRSLGMRLGERVHEVLQLLDGEDRAPLDVWRPPEVPEERIELEWGAQSLEALTFVMKTLCDRLAARLEGRAMAAARIELVLGLDRALCQGKDPIATFGVVLPAPIACAADLFAVVRARLERETIQAPAILVTLRAPELTHVRARTLNFLTPEPKADHVLPRLVAELTAEFGESSIGILALVDTWVSDERTRLTPFGNVNTISRQTLVTSALEPTRLVPPIQVPKTSLLDSEFLMRIEAAQWWRSAVVRHDMHTAWLMTSRGVVDTHSNDKALGSKHPRALAWLIGESTPHGFGTHATNLRELTPHGFGTHATNLVPTHATNLRECTPRGFGTHATNLRGWID
jgi:nucleotidyltransferase/DNA polymerase involved in DNA repair